MKIREYNQMMAYLTRPSTPLERKISEEKIKKNKNKVSPKQMTLPGMEVPQTQLKPLIDLEKILEENEDPIIENRGKQTEALINTTNKHIKDQIKKGNIKKEDLLLKQDSNGLMVNKNKTIAIRDSFMAKQFNRALGVNDEPQATPEQVGKLAERLERNAQMTGGKGPFTKIANNLGKKKPVTKTKLPEFKIEPSVFPVNSFVRTAPDPETIRMEQRFNELVRKGEEEKIKNQTSGIGGLLGGKKAYE